jgi:hypothetical protein
VDRSTATGDLISTNTFAGLNHKLRIRSARSAARPAGGSHGVAFAGVRVRHTSRTRATSGPHRPGASRTTPVISGRSTSQLGTPLRQHRRSSSHPGSLSHRGSRGGECHRNLDAPVLRWTRWLDGCRGRCQVGSSRQVREVGRVGCRAGTWARRSCPGPCRGGTGGRSCPRPGCR